MPTESHENQKKKGVTFDLFISHAWRFHSDWVAFSDLLDRDVNFGWRNFSLPWHDPAFNPNTESGRLRLTANLESQIIPVHSVILLSGVFSIMSAKKWCLNSIELAKKHQKPIIGVVSENHVGVFDEVSSEFSASCDFNSTSLFYCLSSTLNKE